jgi:hypothetical protein
MSVVKEQSSTPQGLGFLALLSFIASFLGARAFTTLFPSSVVETGGVHLHHFWYGLAMIVVTGWLGIAQIDPRFRRLYAIVFGIGGGLVGDEAGLLLTLGNYGSDLTYFVVVTVVGVGAALLLVGTRRKELQYDVFSVGYGEKTVYAGIIIAGASALSFSVGYYPLGVATLVVGLGVAAAGVWLHRRKTSPK